MIESVENALVEADYLCLKCRFYSLFVCHGLVCSPFTNCTAKFNSFTSAGTWSTRPRQNKNSVEHNWLNIVILKPTSEEKKLCAHSPYFYLSQHRRWDHGSSDCRTRAAVSVDMNCAMHISPRDNCCRASSLVHHDHEYCQLHMCPNGWSVQQDDHICTTDFAFDFVVPSLPTRSKSSLLVFPSGPDTQRELLWPWPPSCFFGCAPRPQVLSTSPSSKRMIGLMRRSYLHDCLRSHPRHSTNPSSSATPEPPPLVFSPQTSTQPELIWLSLLSSCPSASCRIPSRSPSVQRFGNDVLMSARFWSIPTFDCCISVTHCNRSAMASWSLSLAGSAAFSSSGKCRDSLMRTLPVSHLEVDPSTLVVSGASLSRPLMDGSTGLALGLPRRRRMFTITPNLR